MALDDENKPLNRRQFTTRSIMGATAIAGGILGAAKYAGLLDEKIEERDVRLLKEQGIRISRYGRDPRFNYPSDVIYITISDNEMGNAIQSLHITPDSLSIHYRNSDIITHDFRQTKWLNGVNGEINTGILQTDKKTGKDLVSTTDFIIDILDKERRNLNITLDDEKSSRQMNIIKVDTLPGNKSLQLLADVTKLKKQSHIKIPDADVQSHRNIDLRIKGRAPLLELLKTNQTQR